MPTPPSAAHGGQFDEAKHPRQQGRFRYAGGRHPRPGKGWSPKRTVEEQPSAKATRAKAAHVLVDKDIQRYAEEHNEPRMARALGGVSFRDNEPVDIVVGKGGVVTHGIELKTMVVGGNRKITMKGSALDRKEAWEKANKATYHTLVVDDTKVYNAKGPGLHDESKRRVFYRRGAGSFRVDGMFEVKGGAPEIKRLLNTPHAKLPAAAQRLVRKGR